MSKYITSEQQRLVIEKLYRSNDSITSTNKFNAEYQGKINRMGEQSMKATDFARKMKQSSFSSYDIERFTKDVTGKSVDLETL